MVTSKLRDIFNIRFAHHLICGTNPVAVADESLVSQDKDLSPVQKRCAKLQQEAGDPHFDALNQR